MSTENPGVQLKTNMVKPLVSFIIPVLNGERDIERCLLSIRNLDFPREQCEVFVMDNGSTDKTHKIVQCLGFDLHVVPKVRVGALRNRGVVFANGNYFAFVDADVELMPWWLKNGLAAFEDPNVLAAGCFPGVPQPATWVQQAWDLHQRGKQSEKGPVAWLPSMNLIVRRNTFVKIKGFNEELETAEDVDLCYRLGQHGTILNVPAMQAIHWGEARDLRSFWRKEVWRGMGNLRGIFSHGFRWDEFPSVAYPFYIWCCAILAVAGVFIDLWYRQFMLAPLSFISLGLPALLLGMNTAHCAKQSASILKLFLLYLVYGFARAYALVKS